MQIQSAQQTIQDICRWRPALSSVLAAFSPLIQKQEDLSAHYCTVFSEKAYILPAVEPARFQMGVSVLENGALPDLAPYFFECAKELSPYVAAIPRMKDSCAAYVKCFCDLSKEAQAAYVDASTSNTPNLLEGIAQSNAVDLFELALFANFVVSPILHDLVMATYGATYEEGEKPWDTNTIWQQGYCPVCGAFPVIAWLDRGKVDERNTYLLPGGGRKHLHCGVCGADWRFLRLACPACGIAKSKKIEILSEENNTHGESLDFCSECKSYCPVIDVRERIAMPNLEAQALGMLHLELTAFEKNLHPLRASFWNTFD